MIDTNGTAVQGMVLPADDVLPVEMRFDAFEDWRAFGVRLHKADEHLNWVAGEWLAFGKREYGDAALSALKAIVGDATGQGASALKQALWMAEKYPAGTRVPEVSYTAHRAVAGLPEEDRRELLEEARDEGLSTRQVQQRVEERKASPAPTVEPPPEPVAGHVPSVVVDVAPEIALIPPPGDQGGAWMLIADLAAFIRDRVMTKLIVVDGQITNHDRHCGATAERPTCAEKCSTGRALITRAELL